MSNEKHIRLREISPELAKAIEEIRNHYHASTETKAIKTALGEFMAVVKELDKLKDDAKKGREISQAFNYLIQLSHGEGKPYMIHQPEKYPKYAEKKPKYSIGQLVRVGEGRDNKMTITERHPKPSGFKYWGNCLLGGNLGIYESELDMYYQDKYLPR